MSESSHEQRIAKPPDSVVRQKRPSTPRFGPRSFEHVGNTTSIAFATPRITSHRSTRSSVQILTIPAPTPPA